MNNSSCENDNRTFLNDGTIINLKGTEYRILELKGRGASCVVYLAENCSNNRRVLIKEFYPKKCDITRDKNNNLVISNSDSNIYRILKEQLRKAYKLQLEFHNSDETGNYTSDAETMVEAYSTLYVIMNKVVGSSYDKVVPENITDVLEVCKSVATVIGFYHKKGYLHLDIKPDNIYVLKETNQIINLFDFDTVKSKSDLENGNYIASTNKISAPEISKAEIDEFTGKYLQEVDERADIYAIGHILFEKVMERDAKSSDIILGKKFNLGKTKLLKNSSPQLREMIQEIFQHTVVRMKSERYSNTDELIKALDQALKIATEEKDGYLIDNNIAVTTSSNYYISRKDKLSEIRQHLENYHIAYLYGIGGIGKSETAREYAEEYRGSYTTIQLSIYSGDLKALIAGLKIARSKNSDDCNQTDDSFEKDINIRYGTRLAILSQTMMNNERTLLIIDNYNVEPDSDEYKRNVEVMKDLKKLHIHILFTTRTLPNDDKTKIDVEEFSKEELRHMFFAINPKDKDKEERIAQVHELIETAYRHTLTVDLVAHQTAKIEGYGKKTLSDYIKVLKECGINSGINVAVYNNKDDNGKSDIIFEHIRALFNLTALTEKEKYIMVNACLLPLSGMPVAEFESFIDLENYPDSESNDGWGEDSTISNLVKGGWIKRIGSEVSRITLHPIVSEVTVNELKPNLETKSVYTFVNNLVTKFNCMLADIQYLYSNLDLMLKLKILKCDDVGTAEMYINIGRIMYFLSEFAYAIEYINIGLDFCKKTMKRKCDNSKIIFIAYKFLLNCYVDTIERKQLLNVADDFLKFIRKNKRKKTLNSYDLLTSYMSCGVAYFTLISDNGFYIGKSLFCFEKALQIRNKDETNFLSEYYNCCYYVTSLYIAKGDYTNAIKICEDTISKMLKDIKKPYFYSGEFYHLLYEIYAKFNNTEFQIRTIKKELQCYSNILKMNSLLVDDLINKNYVDTINIDGYNYLYYSSNVFSLFRNIANDYTILKEYEIALKWYVLCEKICENVYGENSLKVREVCIDIVDLCVLAGYLRLEAQYYLKIILIDEMYKLKSRHELALSYDHLCSLYFSLGDDKNAKKCFEQFEKYNDQNIL